MENRHVIEWEKVDIEYLKFVKVDILGLGMLGCLRRAFELLEAKGETLTLDANELQGNDGPTYEMIRQADTLGVFQIESRAQMSMLPRMKPIDFYDLAIQIAIVRPGPIQGDMVHPYLKRREEQRRALARGKPYKIDYPLAELAEVLDKTLGVPLFQEQAMNVAIKGAGFTPAEADALRQAMATFKMTGGVGKFRAKLIAGMKKKGIGDEFAERLVKQIEGFGSYGFPESHAASFAKIAYASSWMKCHHPDVFCTALLNAQPMGFYAPAQIVRDAREHGVEVRPVCINDSGWDTRLLDTRGAEQPRGRFCGTEKDWAKLLPIRLGMKIVQGLSQIDADHIAKMRGNRRFESIEDIRRRTGLPLLALEKLARADAFHSFGFDRRQALWRVKGLGETPLPLFAASDDVRADGVEPETRLTPLTAGREVVEDYRATQMTLRAHPVSFLRDQLRARGIVPCANIGPSSGIRDGARVEVAGLILVRQRPGSAKGVVFVTLEDESGIANAVLWADRFEAHRRTVMSATMLSIRGRVQREGIVIHLVADAITDLTDMLREVGEIDLPCMTVPGDGATHGGTIDPRDRKVGWPKQRALEAWPARAGREAGDLIPVKSHDFH